jgi:hypothetical protein
MTGQDTRRFETLHTYVALLRVIPSNCMAQERPEGKVAQ